MSLGPYSLGGWLWKQNHLRKIGRNMLRIRYLCLIKWDHEVISKTSLLFSTCLRCHLMHYKFVHTFLKWRNHFIKCNDISQNTEKVSHTHTHVTMVIVLLFLSLRSKDKVCKAKRLQMEILWFWSQESGTQGTK